MGYRSVDDEIIYEMEQKKMLEDALEQAKSSNIAKNTFYPTCPMTSEPL